jgi:pimeloyl-ACP methyl ester carboxylesterase
MSPLLMVMLISGVLVVLLAMLIVTQVARRVDRSGTRTVDIMSPDARKTRKAFAGAIAAVIAGVSVLTGIVMSVKDNKEPPVASEISTGELHGTLLSPSARAPVVLIVPGSGPTDRDGNNPLGVKAQPYRLLAEGLAKRRIATVRVDKRGMFGSAGAGDPNITSLQPYIDDYHAWIDAVRAERKAKCVWLLGHSEGALMVSLAAQGRKDVCGLILVSGMGRKMGDVIRDQLKANPANAPIMDDAMRAISELEAGRTIDVSAMHPALQQLFAPQVQPYLIAMFATDPVEAVRAARVKTLVVQGTNDIQVSVEDARLLNKAPRTKLQLIKGMNHVLKDAPEDRMGNAATYLDPNLPVPSKLVREIADFVKGDD